MFLCRYAISRIIITIALIDIIIIVLPLRKKVAAISKHCRYHDCTISNDSSNHSLKSLHLFYCLYYSVLPSNSLSRD